MVSRLSFFLLGEVLVPGTAQRRTLLPAINWVTFSPNPITLLPIRAFKIRGVGFVRKTPTVINTPELRHCKTLIF